MANNYRKKPVEIEAWQWLGQPESALPLWLRGRVSLVEDVATSRFTSPGALRIPTLEGVMTASFMDWIIKGVEGEIYPCKPSIFAATYEPISPSPQPDPKAR